MQNEVRSFAGRYGVAVLSLLAATLLTSVFFQFLQTEPYAIAFAAVMLSAWYGGLWPGLFTVIGGSIIFLYLFTSPYHSFRVTDTSELIEAGLFLIVGTQISFLSELLHRSWKQDRAHLQKLALSEERLRMDIAERKEIERGLRESEHRFRKLFDDAPFGLAMAGLDRRILEVNHAYCEMMGYTEQELVQVDFVDITHPEDRERDARMAEKLFRGEVQSYSVEKRYITKSGEVIWANMTATIIRDRTGAPMYGLGMVQDITEKKRIVEQLKNSSEQLRSLSAHLQTVREEERRSIAREIHDELGQLLTGLIMELNAMEEKLAESYGSDSGLLKRVRSMIGIANRLIESVRKIATDLRPAILDDFGLVAAMEWYAQEFQRRSGIECVFSSTVESVELTPAQQVAIFRVFQESLTNVARHAKATHVEAHLEDDGECLILQIEDDGKGTMESDLADPKSLGVLGMKERMAFLGGSLSIHGMRKRGTRVTARIPLCQAQPAALCSGEV